MGAPFTLGPDEGIIFETAIPQGELTLTHERIIQVTRGIFGGVKSVWSMYLFDIKIIDDEAQLSLKRAGGLYVLTACLDDGTVVDYGFPTKYEAQTWINEISQQVTGHPSKNAYVESEAVKAIKDLGIQVKGAAKSLEGAFGQRDGQDTAGAKRGLFGAGRARAALEEPMYVESWEQVDDLDSLDEQVAAVRKLKALLDEGLLTQEEFDQKKREILNL